MNNDKLLGAPLLQAGDDSSDNLKTKKPYKYDKRKTTHLLSNSDINKQVKKVNGIDDLNLDNEENASSKGNSKGNSKSNSKGNSKNNTILPNVCNYKESDNNILYKNELFYDLNYNMSKGDKGNAENAGNEGNENTNINTITNTNINTITNMNTNTNINMNTNKEDKKPKRKVPIDNVNNMKHNEIQGKNNKTYKNSDIIKNDYKIRIKYFNKYLKYNVHKIYNGENFLYYLQTNELLKMVHQIKGENENSVKYKSGLAQYRDIRQLVSNNTNTRFDISPKRNCVLLNLPYRKCIIFKDFLYYIPTFTNSRVSEIVKKEEKMCEYFIENAKVISLIKGSLPFEILILEAIFVDVCDELKNEIDPVVAEAEKLFEVISSNLSVYKCMNKLTEMRRKLKIVDEKVQSVYKSIQAVLNNDEDVKRLEVSYFWDKPELWDECGPTPNNEDTEMLLEYYCHEIEEFLKMIRRTDESLDDLLQMVELNLDDARNNVLKLELGLKIYGIVISVVGTIAAIFGMNIKNGFEGDEMIFWGLAFLLMLISFFCLFYVFISFRKVSI